MDRGLPAIWLFSLLQQRKLPFLARMDGAQWPAVEQFLRSGQKETVVTLNVSPAVRRQAEAAGQYRVDHTLTLRLSKVILSSGTIEVLATSLLDAQAYLAEALARSTYDTLPEDKAARYFPNVTDTSSPSNPVCSAGSSSAFHRSRSSPSSNSMPIP